MASPEEQLSAARASASRVAAEAALAFAACVCVGAGAALCLAADDAGLPAEASRWLPLVCHHESGRALLRSPVWRYAHALSTNGTGVNPAPGRDP